MLTSTHKTYYYIFLPSKEEEMLINANPAPYIPTRSLVEIRDIENPSTFDPNDPWCIKKTITLWDLREGKLTLTHDEAFDHVFSYWSMDMANLAVFGSQKLSMIMWDHTYWVGPKRHVGPNIYFEKGPNDTYFLGWTDLARDLRINPGDQIGLFWGNETNAFHVKLLRRKYY